MRAIFGIYDIITCNTYNRYRSGWSHSFQRARLVLGVEDPREDFGTGNAGSKRQVLRQRHQQSTRTGVDCRCRHRDGRRNSKYTTVKKKS